MTRLFAEMAFYALSKRSVTKKELKNVFRVSDEILATFIDEYSGFIESEPEEIRVTEPLELALKLIDEGVEIGKISEVISWRDFEHLTSKILDTNGYEVYTNMVLASPSRFQVDVVGVSPISGIMLVVDCKHWDHSSGSKLREVSEAHLTRVKKFIKYLPYMAQKYPALTRGSSAIPVIVTLRKPPLRSHSGVVVVSIREFNDFLVNLSWVLEELGINPLRKEDV